MNPVRLPRLGLRREVLILLPIATLLLVVLSTFTLLAYRSAISLLIEDRQRQVARLAQILASDLALGPFPSTRELRQKAPLAERIALVEESGRIVTAFGQPDASQILAPISDRVLTSAIGLGPDTQTGDLVSGFARFERNDATYFIRVDQPEYVLSRQRRMTLRLLWVVLPINIGLLLLIVLFLPTLLKPYETLLRQAQRIGQEPGDEDEVSFLISTVDKALEALARASDQNNEDDIDALQRALGSSLESGLLLIDHRGEVLSLNSLGEELIELDSPPSPTPLDEFLAPHPALLQMLSDAVESSGSHHRQEIQIETGQGARTLGLTVHALRRDDGTVRAHLVLFVDLTESQKKAEAKQLATSLAQLGELAAGAAHELRNSLATLKGYLQLIERRPEEESIVDYLSEIHRESDHLQRVLEDFLSFARPDSRRVESVELLVVTRSAAADPALGGKRIEIWADESTPYTIQGDAQLLERAVRNLLHNAARAEADAGVTGPLEVGVKRLEDEFVISIRDSGSGLPTSVRDRLFQPFVTGRSDGVGLGLSLAQRIVTLHGGRIEILDRPEGGTEAQLCFPREITD
jgi:signal transduction histidine kinase